MTGDVFGSVLDDPLELQRFTRWRVDEQGNRRAQSSLRIADMHCAACAGIVESALMRVPGVGRASVSAAAQRAQVDWDPARTRMVEIVAAVGRAGYRALPDTAFAQRDQRLNDERSALWRVFVAAFCAMQVMMLAAPAYFSTDAELAPDLRALLNWGGWVMTLPVLVFSAGPFFAGAWRALSQRAIGMDVPVALGLAITFVASSGATFDPNGWFGREVYFDSLTMFVTFVLGARWLEMRARHRSSQSLESTLAAMPDTAWRLEADGRVDAVSVQRLRPDDRVRVPVGQAFPADGRVIEGATQVDESLLTGESRPVPKRVDGDVVAGSVNLGCPVVMRVERAGFNTRIEAIVELMRQAASERPGLARMADRWAAPFLWAVLLSAALSGAAWSLIDPPHAIWVVVSVLIVTCPCALSLAVPSALLSAAGALARRGVLLQRLDALESLAGAQEVVFDKTGTLTEDRLVYRAAHGLADDGSSTVADSTLLAQAAALAAWSTHPLSRALAEQAMPSPGPWHGVQEIAGEGLQGLDADGCVWRLGSAAFVGAAGQGQPAEGASLWFGPEGRARVRFDFDEAIRADSAATVAALRADGLRVTLLSGDRAARVEEVGRQLGVDDAIGAATPEVKLRIVQSLQRRGRRVVMVGDGLNDAPVLARSDVSIAFGHSALLARARCDAVVTSQRIVDVLHARRLAVAAMRVVRQNIVWAAAYNALCIPLALVGWMPPWLAGLGMASSSLLVVLNARRLAR